MYMTTVAIPGQESSGGGDYVFFEEDSVVTTRRDAIRSRAHRAVTRRKLTSRIAFCVCALATAASLVPLVAIVAYTISRGIHALSVDFFVHNPLPEGIPGGGIANAIVGTLVILGSAAAMAVPVGIAAALFLLERKGPIASTLRFGSDVLSGVPSIAIGLFAYAVLVYPLGLGHYSAVAGSFALAVLMLPIIVRSSEAAMRAVPVDLKEAGLALGARRSRVTRSIVLRGAFAGLVTGNLLALARAAGETAPLLFTVGGSQLFTLSPSQPMASMPLTIFSNATQPFSSGQTTAWGTALVLLVLVLLLSIAARTFAARLNRRAR